MRDKNSRVQWVNLETRKERGKHADVINDFSRAIFEDRDPTVPGEEGSVSLEIVNAITLSSFEQKPAHFPLSREKYTKLMDKLRKT